VDAASRVGVADFTEIGVPSGALGVVESSSSQSSSFVPEGPLSVSSSSQSPSSVGVGGGAEALPEGVEEVVSDPVVPPETPVAAKRTRASSWVSQTMLVPALFTRGSAKHLRSSAQGVRAHLPSTHCANWEVMQAI